MGWVLEWYWERGGFLSCLRAESSRIGSKIGINQIKERSFPLENDRISVAFLPAQLVEG